MFKEVSRREFLHLSSIAAAGSLLALTLTPKRSLAAPGDDAGTLTTAISSNHGHKFVATFASLFAAGPKAYDIRGIANHTHIVTITQEILDTLKQTKVVDVDSSTTGSHSHTVRLSLN